MASIIKIKRSTGITAPSSLNFGELAVTVGVGTFGNKGDRLFVGNSNDDVGEVGGKYFTDLLSIAPGLVAGQVNPTIAANGFVAILDQNRKVDQWNVDNLTLDGNTFSSTNTDGDIILDPSGTGEVKIIGNLEVDEIYYKSGNYNTNGVVFFDSTGLQVSTNSPTDASDTKTSTQILTAVTEITITLSSSKVINAGDQITQESNNSAYGVCKTTINGSTLTLIGVEGTFNTTGNLFRNGVNLSAIPTGISTVYSNKPSWTDAIDGGTYWSWILNSMWIF